MAMPAASHRSTALQALTVFSMLAVPVADVEARHHDHVCRPFSWGALSNISYPFRLQGDPRRHCGPYELICAATNATIRIGSGTYYVLSINYSAWGSFRVLDTNLDMQSSCPLPRWDDHVRHYYPYESGWATFLNCSQEVNDHQYRPVRCLSTIDSFIYVLTSDYGDRYAQNFKPSCGYLALTPLDDDSGRLAEGTIYEDVVKSMRKGFTLLFPLPSISVRECMSHRIRQFRDEPRNTAGIKQQILDILIIDFQLWLCVFNKLISTGILLHIISNRVVVPLVLKSVHVICRFMLVPLVIFIFLAHKYWKTRIMIDAVEEFLRLQQILGSPLRYAYTDIIAITNHFREKLGQGGYGSVYKGVILPGNVHVAIKMLSNSKCNGEDFISEVSTIGRIHHVNVVRLVGFCSEEMRRALVYDSGEARGK